MNKEALKQLAKEHAVTLGSQILGLVGEALINFANQVANPKKTMKTESTLSVVNPEHFAKQDLNQ